MVREEELNTKDEEPKSEASVRNEDSPVKRNSKKKIRCISSDEENDDQVSELSILQRCIRKLSYLRFVIDYKLIQQFFL